MGLSPWRACAGDYFSHDRAVTSGYEGMCRLIESGQHFTAVVIGNDQMAIGALAALHEYGLRVPEDVSVVGFDNSYFSRFLIPPLTTVAFNFDLQSRLAFQFLFEQIENPDTSNPTSTCSYRSLLSGRVRGNWIFSRPICQPNTC